MNEKKTNKKKRDEHTTIIKATATKHRTTMQCAIDKIIVRVCMALFSVVLCCVVID